MKILAIIPARGGSKGIIGKNFFMINGKPLWLGYQIYYLIMYVILSIFYLIKYKIIKILINRKINKM